MSVHRSHCLAAFLAIGGMLSSGAALAATASPTPQQALAYTPTQPLVDYAKPTADEIEQCTIRPEKEGNVTAWVVRNGQGEILRRFADTNADNTVDQWCYFLDGLEVYRDVDSNFNLKADQYRWFHTAGSRWGIDKDENGKIDAWRVISPHEVAEQLVIALKTRDQARFNLLVLTPAELDEMGLGKQQADRVATAIQQAGSGFAKLATGQKAITPQSTFVDFNSSRPGAIPAGTAGSTKDLIVCDNATALVQVGGKHEQVYLGTLVSVGNTWKLIELPVVGSDQQAPGPFLMAPDAATDRTPVNSTAPTEEMQKLMADLERFDRVAEGLPAEQQAANVEQRADLLIRLADVTTDPDLRAQWYRQLIDMLSVAVQLGKFPQGSARLDELEKKLQEAGADEDLLSHVVFQRMWAQYVIGQAQPGADSANLQEKVKLQEKWLADLQDFITKYPKSSDTAEALLQLGMNQEYIGKSDEARKWYTQLATNFPSAVQAAKARGAVRRLSSVGKPLQLRGQGMQGGTVDLGTYRGKVVLIQFWATWGAEQNKEDMILLKDFYVKNANRGFDIIGVNLDESPDAPKQFITENGLLWKHMREDGGLDGRLANELGVMTVPLMLLVDQKGVVVNDNIHVAELDAEVNKLLQKPEAGANAARQSANPQR